MLTIDCSNTQYLFNFRYNTSSLYLKELLIALRGDTATLRLDNRDLWNNLGMVLFDDLVGHINNFSWLLINIPLVNHVLIFDKLLIGICRR